MKKSIITLLSLTALVSLAGCGNSSSKPSSTSEEPTTATTESTESTESTTSSSYDTTIEEKHTATFVAGTETVGTVEFTSGATSIEEPAVPTKTGYDGHWEEYELGDADITIHAIYELSDLTEKNGGYKYEDGKLVTTTTNALGIDKTVAMSEGTISTTMTKAGAEDSGIIFGLTYSGDELANYWEAEGVSYYFFFVSVSNGAYLAKSENGGWKQLAPIAPITDYNEESEIPLSVSVKGGLINCFVGDKCLVKVYDPSIMLAGNKVGYRAGGNGTSYTKLAYEDTFHTDPRDTQNYTCAHGSFEETETGIKTTSGNTIVLDNNHLDAKGKLITTKIKHGVAQDAGLIFGFNENSYHTFWEEAFTSFGYYFFFLNVNGTGILAHVNSNTDVDVWRTLDAPATLKEYSATKEYELGVALNGSKIDCYIDGTYVGGYDAGSEIPDEGYGFRAAQPGCEFTPIQLKEYDATEKQWFLKNGEMKVNNTAEGQVVTTSCDGTLALINNASFAGKGGTLSMDMKFAGGPRNGGIVFGANSARDVYWGNNYYIFETDWDNNAWLADGTGEWRPISGIMKLADVSEAWGADVAQGWNEFHNYKVDWNGAGAFKCYINNVLIFDINIENPAHTGNYFGFFSQGAGETTIKNLQYTVNE